MLEQVNHKLKYLLPQRAGLILAALCCNFNYLSTVYANDSTASLAGGGLVLEKSNEIAILSEKLRIAPRRIVVDYEMQNISSASVETLVAFPLPLLEGPQLTNVPIDVDPARPENFVDFKTSINGAFVTPEKHVRAFQLQENGEKGKDVTAQLSALNILISPLDRSFFDRVAQLPTEIQRKLQVEKLLDVFEHDGERNFTPLWAVEYSYSFRHRFEPGKVERIHHEYIPIAARALFGDFSFQDDLKPWCVDSATEKAIRNLIQQQPLSGGWAKVVERRQVDYILKTGANWAGPIREFELTVEKETPTQIVSLCAEGLKRVSGTEFRLTHREFTPTKDLTVSFFEPLQTGK